MYQDAKDRILRREFLKYSVAGSASVLAGSALPTLADRTNEVRYQDKENGKNFERDYDVVVVGGGVAGIAAAVAAARAKCKVAMIEKSYIPGGLVTAGGVTPYYNLGDYYGNKVSLGLAEELLVKGKKYGARVADPTEVYDPREFIKDPSKKPKRKGSCYANSTKKTYWGSVD